MVNIKHSEKTTTLRRLLENDPTLEEVRVGTPNYQSLVDSSIGYLSSPSWVRYLGAFFFSFLSSLCITNLLNYTVASSRSKLAGEAIGNNDCVSKLVICGGIDEENIGTFMNGVSRNNNIDGLIFVGWDVLNGSVFPYMTPWLRSNNNLTMLQIVRCNGMGGGGLHLSLKIAKWNELKWD